MAGIFGFINKSNKYDSEIIVDYLKRNAQQGFQHSTNHIITNKNTVGLGYASPFFDKSWPIKSKDENYIFQYFGEIYLANESPLTTFNFEEEFLKPFLIDRNKFLLTIDGAFVFALYDRRNNSFTLCNDPFGSFALYYYSNNDLIFSSQLHSITDIIGKKEFDQSGIYEFLGLGLPLNGNTYYNNIKKLQAGEILTYSPKKSELSKYFKLNYKDNNCKKENFEIIKDSFVSSIKKRIGKYESIGAAISGGYDSRITWGILDFLDNKNNVTAFTHGLENSRDMQIAAKIVDKLKLTHITRPFDFGFIKDLPGQWDYLQN